MINLAAASQSFGNLDQVLRVEELYLLQRVALKISSILDLEQLLDEIVGDVAKTFGYNRLAVLLKEQEADELVIAAGWTGELCLKGTRFRIGKGDGMSGHAAATGETFYAADVQKLPFYIVGEQDTRSELDVPLRIRGELIGIFNIQHTEINAFSPERIRLLEALAGHVATAIENARMFQRINLEKQRMAKELEEAGAIQSGLFPRNYPGVAGFEITGRCLPCREIGGDWYDYIPLENSLMGIVLADVSGKGMAAAFLMSSARSVLRLHASRGLSPGQVLSEVNKVLLKDFPTAKFVTLIYAVANPSTRRVTFANAGHLHPLLVDSTGAVFLETSSGMPLGIMECEFSERAVNMTAGSRLFLFSDGLTEAVNSALEEYGTARVREQLLNPSSSVESLLEDVKQFTAGHPASDDMTVVMMAAKPESKA
jgi:phosphoserine phosphatase RsbU/P